jgi:hypothetical protein
MGKKEDFTQVAFRVAQQATRKAPVGEPGPVAATAGRKAGARAAKPRKPRKPKDDFTQVAFRVFKQAIGEAPPPREPKLPPRAAAGQKGGLRGGRVRAERLSPEERRLIAKRAAEARWRKPPQ